MKRAWIPIVGMNEREAVAVMHLIVKAKVAAVVKAEAGPAEIMTAGNSKEGSKIHVSEPGKEERADSSNLGKTSTSPTRAGKVRLLTLFAKHTLALPATHATLLWPNTFAQHIYTLMIYAEAS